MQVAEFPPYKSDWNATKQERQDQDADKKARVRLAEVATKSAFELFSNPPTKYDSKRVKPTSSNLARLMLQAEYDAAIENGERVLANYEAEVHDSRLSSGLWKSARQLRVWEVSFNVSAHVGIDLRF